MNESDFRKELLELERRYYDKLEQMNSRMTWMVGVALGIPSLLVVILSIIQIIFK